MIDFNKPSVLFVDDEIRVIRSLKVLFSIQNEFNVFTAISADEALRIIKSNTIHVIVSDQRMPGKTGVELLKEARQLSPNTIGLLLTGYADLDAIISAINDGEVFRYLTKPWKNQELKEKIAQAIQISTELYNRKPLPSIGIIEENDAGPAQKIMVIHPTDDDGLSMLVNELYGNKHIIMSTSNLKKAIENITSDDCAIVVTDIQNDDVDITMFIKLLKQVRPSILTIVVTGSADANVAISLINQGQVYRFLPKPVKTGRLRLSISSALKYHRRSDQDPKMLRRHRVEEVTPIDSHVSGPTFLEKLVYLRKKLFTTLWGKPTENI